MLMPYEKLMKMCLGNLTVRSPAYRTCGPGSLDEARNVLQFTGNFNAKLILLTEANFKWQAFKTDFPSDCHFRWQKIGIMLTK